MTETVASLRLARMFAGGPDFVGANGSLETAGSFSHKSPRCALRLAPATQHHNINLHLYYTIIYIPEISGIPCVAGASFSTKR